MCYVLYVFCWCSREWVRKIVILLVVIFIFINFYFIWIIGIWLDCGKMECEGFGEYEFFVRKVFLWIDVVLYFMIFVIVILFFNIFIIR